MAKNKIKTYDNIANAKTVAELKAALSKYDDNDKLTDVHIKYVPAHKWSMTIDITCAVYAETEDDVFDIMTEKLETILPEADINISDITLEDES